jgi:protein-S-isoprenylcysteine O-methyltransferase Ste14
MVLGQFTFLVLIVVPPGGTIWTLPVGVARACDVGALAGIVLMVLAAPALGRGLTAAPLPNQHAQLRTGGLYRYVRHPIYTGLLLFSISRSLTTGNGWSAAACLLLVILINVKARWEERHLAQRFPGYLAYARRTPRFLPWSNRR